MLNAKIYNQKGETVGEYKLNDTVFGAEYNEPLIHQVIVAQLANARQGTKSTLGRDEVRGGGKKPWRQKGTGRARQGSIRAPQWIKGGVVFAPKPRDFGKKVNKQAKAAALISALSTIVQEERLVLLDDIKLKDYKTKEFVSILEALKIENSALVLLTDSTKLVTRASNNIPEITTLPSNQVNVYDLVANHKCIATVDAIKKIEEAYKQ